MGVAPLHLPRDGVQEMRLAEADGGVDVERVIATPIAHYRIGDLHGARMRHAVRGADDEALESVARIERRALEATDAGAPDRLRGRENPGASGSIGVAHAVDASVGRRTSGLTVRTHDRTRMRLPQGYLDLLRAFELGAAAGQEIVGVVRLDPGLEELHRHRDLHGLGIEGLEFERMEPAREDVVAQSRPQHGSCLLAARLVGGVVRWPLWSRTGAHAGHDCALRFFDRLH